MPRQGETVDGVNISEYKAVCLWISSYSQKELGIAIYHRDSKALSGRLVVHP